MSRVIGGAVDSSVKKLDSIQKKADNFSKSAFDFGRSAGAIGLAMAAPLGLAVEAAAEFETMNVALKTAFQGNEEAASAAFKQISEFAGKTPYEMGEVMRGFIKLKNMGLDPSIEALTAYGNTASSMGKSLNDMVEAVADAATGEFERLKEFGIKAKSEGDNVTFTFQGVATTVGKNAAEIEAYLKKVGLTKFAGGIEAQSKTFKGQLSTLKDNVRMFSASIGNILVPVLKDMMQSVTPVLDRIQKWTQENPKLTRTIVMGAAALAAILLAASGVAFIFGGLAKIVSFASTAFSVGAKAIGFASKAFQVLATVIRVVSAAMMANPILMIIAAIAAAAFLVYRNWDAIKQWFINLWEKVKAAWERFKLYIKIFWESIKQVFSDAWNWIKNLFLKIPIVGDIIKNWDRIKAFFKNTWDNVKMSFSAFWDWLTGFPRRMYEAGVNIVKSIWEGIKSMVNKPIEAIKEMVGKIREYLPFSPAKVGPLKDIHRLKLVETIASNVKPQPLVKAMRATTAAAMVAAAPVGAAAQKSIAPASGGKTSSAPVSVHYAPVIHMGGGTQSTQDFSRMLKEHEKQIVKLIEEANRKASRAKF